MENNFAEESSKNNACLQKMYQLLVDYGYMFASILLIAALFRDLVDLKYLPSIMSFYLAVFLAVRAIVLKKTDKKDMLMTSIFWLAFVVTTAQCTHFRLVPYGIIGWGVIVMTLGATITADIYINFKGKNLKK